jgi:hypothetical protein
MERSIDVSEESSPARPVACGLAAVTPGAAIFYWLAKSGRLPFDFLFGLVYLLVAASVMLAVVGGMIAFAVWFFSPHR